VHALLGEALMKSQRYGEAEQALKVAVAQSPRNLLAHELLGELYQEHLQQPAEAFAHQGRARSLRHELAALRLDKGDKAQAKVPSAEGKSFPAPDLAAEPAKVPVPFGPEVSAEKVITVVSGLPRSGTSMMMQLLAAGGRQALTDGKREADADNPLGYLEFEKAVDLPKDSSWVPQARGKVVKVVAQLLPFLPRGEFYNVVFMERNLAEVLASQQAMLARQGRRGAELSPEQLMETYQAQLTRVRQQLARRSEMRTLMVDYAELLADPVAGIDRLASFLGDAFDQATAVQVVRPDLQRQRHG